MMGIWTGLTSACQDLASHVPALARAPTVISSPGHRRSTPSAIPAWPSSPVWVLMYWRGTLSTSHVQTRGRPAEKSIFRFSIKTLALWRQVSPGQGRRPGPGRRPGGRGGRSLSGPRGARGQWGPSEGWRARSRPRRPATLLLTGRARPHWHWQQWGSHSLQWTMARAAVRARATHRGRGSSKPNLQAGQRAIPPGFFSRGVHTLMADPGQFLAAKRQSR
jgi:hypothetical protein